ncbi:MAG: putative TetR family transcriptional regulator [Xanthobacteraceae bacterium]|jgi:AcrR family transcriptional regulator|nr:putative TetR family transcriptional regulator [Xanthobacteraceae bacterium]MDF2809436.1 putative TetR family transcriptional regulator [Microvirga sp.]
MPRIVDHQERRQQICDALLDIVAEAGLAAATIREVADRGGWSTGVIGHYFRGRQDLLLGGLRRAAEILAEHNKRVLDTLDGIQALEQLLEGSIPIDGRRLALSRIFFFFYVEAMREEELRQEVETYLIGWRKSVSAAIRRAQESGDLPPDLDPRSAAHDLLGLADGLSMHALVNPQVMIRLREQSPVRYWIRCLGAQSQARSETPARKTVAGRLAG